MGDGYSHELSYHYSYLRDFSYSYSAWVILTKPMPQMTQAQNDNVAKYHLTDIS